MIGKYQYERRENFGVVALVQHMRVAENTYLSMFFLASEDMPPFKRPEYGLSIQPLVRQLFDILSNLVILLEDLPRQSQWYHEAGWREIREEYDRLTTRYAADDPVWGEWIEDRQRAVEEIGDHFSIAPEKRANFKKEMRSGRTLEGRRTKSKSRLSGVSSWRTSMTCTTKSFRRTNTCRFQGWCDGLRYSYHTYTTTRPTSESFVRTSRTE